MGTGLVQWQFSPLVLTRMNFKQNSTFYGFHTGYCDHSLFKCNLWQIIFIAALSSVTGDLGIPEQAQHIKSVEEMEAYR